MTEKGLKERKNTFPKAEHLTGDIRIASVMRTGKSFLVYPVKVIYASDNAKLKKGRLAFAADEPVVKGRWLPEITAGSLLLH